MDIGKISYWSRRIHRISLFFVTGLGLVQVVTGLTLKYPTMMSFINYEWAFQVHIFTSVYFAVFFVISMITGLIMYFAPWLLKYFNKPGIPPTKLPN